MKGYYYLHTNGDLIFKKFYPDASDFVKHVWPIDPLNRMYAWDLILESLALGANIKRVNSLVVKWGCNLKDLVEYMVRNLSPSGYQMTGIRLYFKNIAKVDFDEWCDWLEATPTGTEPDWKTMPREAKNE